jgi:hypothetical protein
LFTIPAKFSSSLILFFSHWISILSFLSRAHNLTSWVMGQVFL